MARQYLKVKYNHGYIPIHCYLFMVSRGRFAVSPDFYAGDDTAPFVQPDCFHGLDIWFVLQGPASSFAASRLGPSANTFTPHCY